MSHRVILIEGKRHFLIFAILLMSVKLAANTAVMKHLSAAVTMPLSVHCVYYRGNKESTRLCMPRNLHSFQGRVLFWTESGNAGLWKQRPGLTDCKKGW